MSTASKVAIALLAAACGGSNPMGGGSGGGGGTMPGAPAASITATEYSFSPATLSVKAGTMVTWTNGGSVSNTATSDAADSLSFDSGTLGGSTPDPYGGRSPGGSFSMTFAKPGTYPYHCSFHGAQGMTGTITVTP